MSLVVLFLLVPLLTSCSVISGGGGRSGGEGASGGSCQAACVEYAFAVTGDLPYDDEQKETFASLIRSVNSDPEIRMVAHLGDIKGEQDCDTDYYREIRADFELIRPSVVYTPGDNDWSDCSRKSAGGYDPLERLSVLRKIFFDHPGSTLGVEAEQVQSQVASGYPENVVLRHAGVSVAAFHTVGPLNGLEVWQGESRATRAQRKEVGERTAADVQLIRDTFATARDQQDKAVILLTQADMFPPRRTTAADALPYRPIVQAIAREAGNFPGPVYLFNGDTHEYKSDLPFQAGSKWLGTYGVPATPNISRVTIVGDENVNHYLKVKIRPAAGKVVGWSMVPLT